MSDERLIEAALDRVTEACLKDGCADMFKKLMDGVAKGSRDQKEQLAAERAKVKSLSEVIESQKQTHDALINKCRELEAQNLELFNKCVNVAWLENQNAVMRDYLCELYQFEKENGVRDRDSIAIKALSLTPSEAAEMVRNYIPKLPDGMEYLRIDHHPRYQFNAGCKATPESWTVLILNGNDEWARTNLTVNKAVSDVLSAIEAARAAGVTTEENQ